MDKFTKAEIVDAIYNKTGMNRKEIRNVVDLLIEEIKAALISRKIIELRGFGTFEIKIRKGRQKARNPKTGELFSVGSHGVALFKAGRELRQDVWNLQREKQSGQPAAEGQTAEGHIAERQIIEGRTTEGQIEGHITDEKTDKSEDGA